MGVKPSGERVWLGLLVFPSHGDHPPERLGERVVGVLSMAGGQLGGFGWIFRRVPEGKGQQSLSRGPGSPQTGVLWGGGGGGGGGWMSLRTCGGAQM